jgi:hypothetical protein
VALSQARWFERLEEEQIELFAGVLVCEEGRSIWKNSVRALGLDV